MCGQIHGTLQLRYWGKLDVLLCCEELKLCASEEKSNWAV